MKVLVINLRRSKERRAHIAEQMRHISMDFEFVEAVDGAALSFEDLSRLTEGRATSSLKPSEVGCALSHVEACRRIANSGGPGGLILEDDVRLPHDLMRIVEAVMPHLRSKEVISLNVRGVRRVEFSSQQVEQTPYGFIHYPMAWGSVMGAAAYLCGRGAAEAIATYNHPVKCHADHWWIFHEAGAITSLRALIPAPVDLMAFESTIGYASSNPWKRLLLRAANRRLLHPVRALRRHALLRQQARNVVVVDQASPLAPSGSGM